MAESPFDVVVEGLSWLALPHDELASHAEGVAKAMEAAIMQFDNNFLRCLDKAQRDAARLELNELVAVISSTSMANMALLVELRSDGKV